MEKTRDRLSRLLAALTGTAQAAIALEQRGTVSDKTASDNLQRAALSYDAIERLPIIFSWPLNAKSEFPPLPNSGIYSDPAAMLYNELVAAWDSLSIGARCLGEGFADDLSLTIRPNWGTVVVASLLGGQAEQSGENSPWIRRRDDRPISLEAIAEADPELEKSGWVPRILDTYEAYHELLSPWPELEATLHITLPDLQGPLDIVEQLVGADLFIDMIERPELAARAFMRAAKLQVACARLFSPMTQDGPSGFTHQHGFLVKGDILIRDDSAVMISPELYRELVAPADEFVLRAMGGGGIHSCGRIWHAVPDMLALPSITSFDFGQSFMNDINGLYSLAKQKRIPFLRVQPTRKELLDGSILERFPTGVSLYYPAASAGEARELLKGYLRACVPGGKA